MEGCWEIGMGMKGVMEIGVKKCEKELVVGEKMEELEIGKYV